MIDPAKSARMASCYWSRCGALSDERNWCASYFCDCPNGQRGDNSVCRLMFGFDCGLRQPWVGVESLEVKS